MTASPRRDPYRLTGETFVGRYRLEEFAGAGSFGAVYRATDTRLGRTVAVKVLKPDIQESDMGDARELFQREALTAGRLTHPNIVAVTDTGEEAGFAFLVMEWLEGRTLDDELRARPTLEPEETAVLLASIADALQAAHDAGVIHRDIKPSNIHLGRAGRLHVKVLDFGIAKVIDSSSAAAASRIAGTLYYMSPEQLGGERIDRRTDIYSLGVMLYQMLTGAMPFSGESQGQIIHQHFVAPPPSLSASRPDLSPALSRVIERSLAKRADERQQSVQELYQEFYAALAAKGFETQKQDAPPANQIAVMDQCEPLIAREQPQPLIAAARETATSQTPPTVASHSPYSPTVLAPQAGGTVEVRQETIAMQPPLIVARDEQKVEGGIVTGLKPVLIYGFVFAILCLLLSVGVGLLARWMEWTTQPYAWDEFALALLLVALRDMIFGAFLGASLSELRRSKPRWPASKNFWARGLLVHGATGAALMMLPFVLLRTSLFMLPLGLAVLGGFLGLLIFGVRFAVQQFAQR
ncbi:MAG: serine/threonine-protein kinase [Pyrinomonadaceae bacterium]